MRRHSFIAHALLGLFSLAAPLSAAEENYKEFKSWQVLCSQTQSCSMRQFLSANAISQFELKRSGAPEAPITLVVSPAEASLTESGDAASVTLAIDGGEATVLDGDAVTIDGTAGTITLSADFLGSGFITALKNGSKLSIGISRGNQTANGEIGLAGAAASLLFIDEYQKRDGHTDAMSAKGEKAPNPALPVSDIRLFADFPENLRARFAEGGECAETEEPTLDGNALAHRLGDDTVLYVTPCGIGGAYNMPYAVFVDTFGTVSSLAFPIMQDGAPSAMGLADNLAYDYESRHFSAFFKGRGVGDCGTVSEWALSENAGGPALLLVAEHFRDCPGEFDENAGADPANWPKTWPLK